MIIIKNCLKDGATHVFPDVMLVERRLINSMYHIAKNWSQYSIKYVTIIILDSYTTGKIVHRFYKKTFIEVFS